MTDDTIDLHDHFFGDRPEFGETRLDAIEAVGETGFGQKADDEWAYVHARTQDRGCMVYSEGIYRVLTTTRDRPLRERLDGPVADTDEVVEAMPKQPRDRQAVPSPSGEYLSVKKVAAREQPDGTIEVDTTGRSTTIPVEYVIEPLTYDEVVCELIDDELGDND